jgi:mRNA-degrading endonuclease RelE of RelBE toxin-antitoxin system
MSYKTLTIPPFDKQLKRLVKKFPSLKYEFASLIESLEINPFQGIALIQNCFKIRISIKSKGKGKRGGARIITHVVVSDKEVYLISIYDKSEKPTLTDTELNELLSLIQ